MPANGGSKTSPAAGPHSCLPSHYTPISPYFTLYSTLRVPQGCCQLPWDPRWTPQGMWERDIRTINPTFTIGVKAVVVKLCVCERTRKQDGDYIVVICSPLHTCTHTHTRVHLSQTLVHHLTFPSASFVCRMNVYVCFCQHLGDLLYCFVIKLGV